MNDLRILHLEDSPDDAELVHATLSLAGLAADIRLVSTREAYVDALEQFAPDLILTDYRIPRFSGLEGLEIRNRLAPDVPLIFVTGSLGDDLAVNTLRLGATDFVLKDRMARLPSAIRRALEDRDRRQAHRQLDAELAAQRELMRATLDAAQAAIVVLDAMGAIVSANPMASRLSGCAPASLAGQAFWDIFPAPQSVDATRERVRAALEWPDAVAGSSWPMSTVAGRSVVWSAGALASPGRRERLVLSGLDITAQRQAEDQAHYLGNYDPATGLPNRTRFVDALAARCRQRAADEPMVMAMLMIALQRLEEIADSDGEEAIAAICTALVGRMAAVAGDEPLLARISDSRLALATTLDRGELERFVPHVLDALAAPLAVDGRQRVIPARAGVALLPDDAADARQLLRAAEAALLGIEADATRNYAFYTPAQSDQARERLQLEAELREALAADDQLVLHYQPQVDLRSGEIVGLESLIRWHHPRLAWLSPARFIPLAEVTGLMNALGNWTLREVCRQLAQWERDGVTAPVVAVNLSASQFAASTLLTDIDRILAQCGTRADRLELELTESAGMRDPQGSVALMTQLRQRGLKISIDDFGTGYSSLSYLKRFPVNRLKVDQSFVRDIVTDADDQAISRAIIAMGHQLKLEVVAEGVETGDQCALLTAAGCDLGQGYLMSRPVAAEQCAALFGKPLPLC